MEADPYLETQLFLLNQLTAGVGSTTVLLILVLILLFFTAVMAGAEVAFFSLSAHQLNDLKSNNTGRNYKIINLLEQPKKLLATLLITNSFLSIGIIVAIGIILKPFEYSLQAQYPQYGTIILDIIQIVLITFLLVLFAEVLPKVYATQNNLKMSLWIAPIVNFFHKAFSPISNLLVRSSALIEKNISAKPTDISESDMEHAIQLTVGHQATADEVKLIKGALNFKDTAVKQIMRPRLDVSGIDTNCTFEQVQHQALECGYSRIPIYDGTLDTIKGMLHTKDLLPLEDNKNTDWHSIVRPAYFIHESKLIEDLLFEFKKRRIHFAIVVDEFGGTSGIVTLEDIMEEIIGDIRDEFDEDDTTIKKINESTYIAEGKTLINDVCRFMDISTETFDDVRGESDTIAGLYLEVAGNFPLVGHTITIGNYSLMVMEIEKHRLQKIKIINETTSL